MAMRLSFFRLSLVTVVLAWLVGGGLFACLAAEPLMVDPQARVELDIAAQDLAGALDSFSRQTGMAVLVDRDLTRARRSLAVHGRYRASEALSLLLTGSGLMARYARADAFTLQVAQVSDVPSPRDPGGSKGAALASSYARAIQLAIEQALCALPLTRPGTYRAVLQVWIGQGGELQHSRLVSSTGDVQRDGALVERLRTVRVERPAPSSLRQPVTLLLMPDSAGTSMDCTERKGAAGV
ncbi:TonB-dependent outer membrane receptor [Pseudomonas gingeri NCPPB 3146 = LMG 5327]|uniref:TonB-dependent outer membrane receptor n=3 Tax=Pseudomonas gingeri TaxID=117681 RepID=A0A7Y7XXK9_9PSED|nr:TonB-dependent outer membrane receptor [Pseudomonas gingeri]PNQ92656.1 TonB-dependent outer membrane receptor [Pseudomonas gingeri NCPPB 3146 = LMG 5327]